MLSDASEGKECPAMPVISVVSHNAVEMFFGGGGGWGLHKICDFGKKIAVKLWEKKKRQGKIWNVEN